MQKKLVCVVLALSAVSLLAIAGNVASSIGGDNSFNGNQGSININQHNNISNSDAVVERRISELVGQGDKTAGVFGAIASDANASSGSRTDKGALCQQKVDAYAKLMGYNFGVFLSKCKEVFK